MGAVKLTRSFWINRSWWKPDLTAWDKITFNKLSTVQEAIHDWTERFADSNVPEAEISAKYIIAHAFGIKRLGGLTSNILNRRVTNDEQNKISKLCERRLERVPVQYIVGEWDFRNLTLLMRPPVFVPCPETEELVELVLNHYSPKDKLHFFEVGCGTGAICLSLLVELPQAHVTVIERSLAACELTKENARRLGVLDRLTIHHQELSSKLPRCLHGSRFDAIVSNPPYIANAQMKNVSLEVLRHEDNAALNGGEDGLDHIKNICKHARHILKPDAFIWLETDLCQSEMIDDWLQQNPITRLTLLKTYEDFAHKPRFCQLQHTFDYWRLM